MSSIKELLKQYKEVNAELNKQIRENGEAFMQQLNQIQLVCMEDGIFIEHQ